MPKIKNKHYLLYFYSSETVFLGMIFLRLPLTNSLKKCFAKLKKQKVEKNLNSKSFQKHRRAPFVTAFFTGQGGNFFLKDSRLLTKKCNEKNRWVERQTALFGRNQSKKMTKKSINLVKIKHYSKNVTKNE